jgi:hypothetical protein
MEVANKAYKDLIKSIELENILLDSLKVKRYSQLKQNSLDVDLTPDFSIKKIRKGELIALAILEVRENLIIW